MRKQVTWDSNWKKKKRRTLQGDKMNSLQGNSMKKTGGRGNKYNGIMRVSSKSTISSSFVKRLIKNKMPVKNKFC